MIDAALIFDLVLAISLPLLAWRVFAARDLFQTVVLFIVLGLLIALAYARLNAPDVALAEAAIGAGLTGALLLDTLGRIGDRYAPARSPLADRARGQLQHLFARLPLALLTWGLGAILAWAVLSLPVPPVDLPAQVQRELPNSGVTNPVTAVLLNFRSYDTLLEIGVLLLAVVGVWSLRLAPWPVRQRWTDRPVLTMLVRLLVPVMVVVAGYLLWAGSSQPGGAFQAGAILAAIGELLLLAALIQTANRRGWPIRIALTLGFAVFLAVAVGVVALGGNLLEYPSGLALRLILLIETMLTISIGFTLALLFFGADPAREDEREQRAEASA